MKIVPKKLQRKRTHKRWSYRKPRRIKGKHRRIKFR